MSYWDTSPLAKLHLQEPDSAIFESLGRSAGPINTARLAAYELRATLMRKEAEGLIATGAADSAMLVLEGDIILQEIVIHDESEAVSIEYDMSSTFAMLSCLPSSSALQTPSISPPRS